MRREVAFMLVALALCTVAERPAASQERLPDGAVRIDGRKNPELFSEWFIWETAFRGLRYEVKQKELKRMVDFTEDEWKLIVAAGEQQTAREARLSVRSAPLLAGAAKGDAEAQWVTVDELNIEYRWEILKASETLMAALRPATAAGFRRWMDGVMGRSVLILQGHALKQFYVPK